MCGAGEQTTCVIGDVTGAGSYTLVVRAESQAGLGPVSGASAPVTSG